MYDFVDYIAQRDEEMRIMRETEPGPLSDRALRGLEEIKREFAERSEKILRSKDEEKRNDLEFGLWPAIKAMAWVQGGRAEMHLDEESYLAQIVYIGRGLDLDMDGTGGIEEFRLLLAMADTVFTSVTPEGLLKLQFFIHLFHEIEIGDPDCIDEPDQEMEEEMAAQLAELLDEIDL